jgi:signal transduction histidine kinase
MNEDRPISSDEEARLAALTAYGILDTPGEEAFDRYVRVASAILRVPIALVTLVDRNRQWFKSRIGVDVDQTDRCIAFCDYAIRSDEVMVVPDARQDARFLDNPLVVNDPHVRFYAGAPLVTPEGHRIGTLCVIDQKPRDLNAEEIELLRDLAHMVVDTLELRRMGHVSAQQATDLARIADESRHSQLQAERLLQQKSLFIAAMAHELRTPLNAIIGFTDLIREDKANEISDERRREFIDIVNASGQHLLDLINDLLDLSKLEAGRFEVDIEPLDIAAAAQEVHRMMAGLAKDSGLKFDVRIDPKLPPVMGDLRAVKQILVNLTANAIKFTPKGGYVVIVATAQADVCRLYVSDTGRGIAPDDLKRVTEPYRQASSNNVQQDGGTGLGLAICQRLVQLLGSSLEIESSLGNGTTVSFALPFMKSNAGT